MQNRIFDFASFINEADLRGNIGIPGEEGSGGESWLDKISQSSDRESREFATQNRGDIQNFMGLVRKSQDLQRGYEDELSELATTAIQELYGSLLDTVELDLKIEAARSIKQEMEKTPTEQPELEEILDTDLINQINKRKILRTIQQGKGLSVKAILNLSIFKDGLADILGEQAEEYLSTLNKISTVAQFFDWTIPEEAQKGMWQSREGFSGSCSLEFEEEKEGAEDIAQKVLSNLENGEDILNNEDAEDLISGIGVKVRARGVDLSVLIHESIKGIYKLITQASLESLYGGEAEKVLANTDTLFDELQEIKYGRQMQNAFFKVIADHPRVKEVIESMISTDSTDVEIASFQEKINFLFFGKIAMLGQEDAKEMLTVVNAILSESEESIKLCNPIIEEVLSDLDQEEEYQRSQRGDTRQEAPEYTEDEEPEVMSSGRDVELSQDEINDLIMDAYEKGGVEAANAARKKYLGEGKLLPFSIWRKLNS
jgi:hypothetical protein